MSARTSKPRSPRTVRYLARAIARRCEGRTLVLGRGFPDLIDALETKGLDAEARALEFTGGSAGPFETVVLVKALEYEEPQATRDRLLGAWKLVRPRGQLLVCVPNEDHVEDAGARQRFALRGLKKLLKEFDWPRVFTDQPYGWLFMSVSSGPRIDRINGQRYRVIAGLCRGRVLELGCGAGQLCEKIAKRGHAVVGVDKNGTKIAKARRLYPDLEFEDADILGLTDRPPYDTVVLAEVLEHVPVDAGDEMLRKAWSLVAPGGRLVVGVPNEGFVRHANHLREFTQADLISLLKPMGRPRLVTDQPFKWLLAYVDRQEDKGKERVEP